jgi:hypothetical protein
MQKTSSRSCRHQYMNHKLASIKKHDKKESKRRKEDEGKIRLVRMMVVGKEETNRTIRTNKEQKQSM